MMDTIRILMEHNGGRYCNHAENIDDDDPSKHTIVTSSHLLQPFPFLGLAHQVFNLNVLWSCASIFTCFSFCCLFL